jgi:hypothetical protein
MWTEEGIKKFIDQHPIDTGGAMKEHQMSIEIRDDGDIYAVVHVDYWPGNKYVSRGVFSLVMEAMQRDATATQIYLNPNYVELHLYISVCDGD